MTKFCFGYSTTDSLESARKIAKTLLEKQLIACANIIPAMESHYIWKGNIEKSQECVLILKTRKDLTAKIKETLLEIHTYECPCLVFLPIESGYEEFLTWMEKQTQLTSSN